MTLEELLKQAEGGKVGDAISLLAKYVKDREDEKWANLSATMEKMTASHAEIRDLLQKLLDKPEKEYPEPKDFPETQKVSMERPDWYQDPVPHDHEGMAKAVSMALAPHFDSLEEKIGNEHEATRQAMMSDEAEETDGPKEEKDEARTVNVGAVRSRRTTQWKIATYPQIAGTVGLTSGGDGKTFYLPSAVIPNSETIRLNGGIPLSQGVDYTLSGNKITYVQDQTNSQHEVRYQTR